MKNKYKILTLLFLVTAFFGCQNEGITDSIIDENTSSIESVNAQYDFNVEVKNDMLSFATRDDYDQAIEFLGPQQSDAFADWEEDLKFSSMRSAYSKKEREDLGIFDDLLATLINKDAMIEIAGNVFKLNALDETVTMFSSKDSDNSSKSGTRVFSTDDNILDILEGTDTEGNTARRHYCSSNKRGTYNVSIAGFNVSYKIVYQKAGFLNSLVANLKKNTYNGRVNQNLKTVGSNFWRNKRRSGTIPAFNQGGSTREYDYRPYYSSRRLTDYKFEMEYNAWDTQGGGQSFTQRLRINH